MKTSAQAAIANDEMAPDSTLEQAAIVDEIHRQQFLADITGQCEFGCDASCLIRAWSFSIRPREGFTPGMKTVCRYTRLPCEQARFGLLFEVFGQLNRNARPLLFGIDGGVM